GAIGVSHEIILAALAVRIRLVFKILCNKSLNQCPWRSTPPQITPPPPLPIEEDLLIIMFYAL
ncbi:hypothetical protein, partial [Lapidilactobacillus wuchangensis]|uniref:hypothetical protein n=1 Tax=Lapidilactobacillus wuchangensis TaxID=2486001 RepID=UPI001CDBE3C8